MFYVECLGIISDYVTMLTIKDEPRLESWVNHVMYSID
jgi:hypothetical protein